MECVRVCVCVCVQGLRSDLVTDLVSRGADVTLPRITHQGQQTDLLRWAANTAACPADSGVLQALLQGMKAAAAPASTPPSVSGHNTPRPGSPQPSANGAATTGHGTTAQGWVCKASPTHTHTHTQRERERQSHRAACIATPCRAHGDQSGRVGAVCVGGLRAKWFWCGGLVYVVMQWQGQKQRGKQGHKQSQGSYTPRHPTSHHQHTHERQHHHRHPRSALSGCRHAHARLAHAACHCQRPDPHGHSGWAGCVAD